MFIMGFFSSICSGLGSCVKAAISTAKAVGSAVKSAVTTVVEKGKEVVDTVIEKGKEVVNKVIETREKVGSVIREGVTNLWNKFSGEDKQIEADRIYEEMTKRYNTRRQLFEDRMQELSEKIESHVQKINASKSKIKMVLFPALADKISKLKDVNIDEKFSIEEFKANEIELDSVRGKSQLYKIDFKEHRFKTTVQAIFTLGFYTRKKAQETLDAVREEEAKVNTEIKKMDAYTKKIETIEISLANDVVYFEQLIELYERLLVRLDNTVNVLYIKCISFAHRLIKEEMSIKWLSTVQRKEVEAIVTASLILKEMAETQLLAVDNENDVKKYEDTIHSKHTEFIEATAAA